MFVHDAEPFSVSENIQWFKIKFKSYYWKNCERKNHHEHYTRSIAKINFYLKRINTRCGQQRFSYSGID